MDQPQTENDQQSQDYQYEQTQEAAPTEEHVATSYAINISYQQNQQGQHQQPQPSNTKPNGPEAQQHFQPQAAHQQQAQQYTIPQANMGYGAQPGQHGPYPPQPHQTIPMYSNGLNQQPAAYPPPSPQLMSPQPNPVNYPSQAAPQQQAFAQVNYQAPQAVQYPPQNNVQGAYVGMPPSPHKPAHQVYNAAPGMPAVHMSPMQQPQQVLEGWRTGLFDCMDDPMNALITAIFPCLTFGQVAEIVDSGQTSCGTSGLIYGAIACCIWIPCIMSCTYRTKLRSKFGLIESPAPDWVTHFLFEWCALCQEYRELQLRGLDPSIGWHGNVMKNQSLQQPQVAMMPPVNQRMMG